jgi:hypothetical protein
MCDYDYDWSWFSERHVIARKPHDCCSCDDTIKPGDPCFMGTGRNCEGVLQSDFICQTCEFLMNEAFEGTPTHICRGGLQAGEYENGWERHAYVRQCLEEGEPVIMSVLELIEGGWLNELAKAGAG